MAEDDSKATRARLRTKQVNLRLATPTVDRVDRIARVKSKRAGIEVDRPRVLREVIEIGLRELERTHAA